MVGQVLERLKTELFDSDCMSVCVENDKFPYLTVSFQIKVCDLEKLKFEEKARRQKTSAM